MYSRRVPQPCWTHGVRVPASCATYAPEACVRTLSLTSLVRYRLPSHHRWRHEDGTPNIDELMHGALRAATVPVDVDIEVDGVSSGARQTVQMTLEEYAAWWTRQVHGVCMV